jgi:hypothetical protein
MTPDEALDCLHRAGWSVGDVAAGGFWIVSASNGNVDQPIASFVKGVSAYAAGGERPAGISGPPSPSITIAFFGWPKHFLSPSPCSTGWPVGRTPTGSLQRRAGITAHFS